MNIFDPFFKNMNDIAIKLSNVSKRFKLYKDVITDPIKEHLFFWKRHHYYQEFMAVKNVSFEVKKGEVVGIIGQNGAGKTTLLKMIAGLLPVDNGRIEINGKVTALLTLGVGFHPEFSGRENIFYGGMLLGMSKTEVLQKISSIIEFSELEDYIDRPFRTYSSGMKARLIFSTSISIEPDILIIDEALATGDAAFVAKSSRRIKELCNSQTTILFVSHNLRQIQELCQRCLVMQKGSLLFAGDTSQAIATYIDSFHQSRAIALSEANVTFRKPFQGTGEILIEDFYFVVDGHRTETLEIGKPCELHIDFEAFQDLNEVGIVLELYSEKSPIRFAYVPYAHKFVEDNSWLNNFAIKAGKSKLLMTLSKLVLGDGVYWCNIVFFPAHKDYWFSYDTCYCYYVRAWSFQAIYTDPKIFGRETLSEIPVKSIEVKRR